MRVVRHLVAAASTLARDSRIPGPLRAALAVGLLPLPGPLDEVILVLVGLVLLAFYREPMRQAWDSVQTGLPRSPRSG